MRSSFFSTFCEMKSLSKLANKLLGRNVPTSITRAKQITRIIRTMKKAFNLKKFA